jgi:hypothetical protein
MSLIRPAVLGTLLAAAAVAAPGTTKPAVTYSKHVAPILFKNCASCHRVGEGAPMPLLSYKETRPWAKAIKQAVATRKMPPWLADPSHGKFSNDCRLSQADIDTIVNWVDAGSPEGNVADMPPTPVFVSGWQLGKPDMVIEMPVAFDVPAEGVIPYKYFTAPTNFTEDKWVRAVEIRAGNPAVVHHIIMSIREPGSAAASTTAASDAAEVRSGRRVQLAGTAPGLQPTRFPDGVAKLIKAGSELVFQMHYTPNGKAATDRSYVGLYFSKEPARFVAQTAGAMNVALRIPPGDPNHEVKSSWTAKEDVMLFSLMPHMHVRGKDFKYTATFPDGRTEVLLNVPRYDFNWQLGYTLQDPILLPKGTRIDCVAHYDNSPNNKYNPDPTKEVRWGDQTWEEMMIGWFSYTIPGKPVSTN